MREKSINKIEIAILIFLSLGAILLIDPYMVSAKLRQDGYINIDISDKCEKDDYFCNLKKDEDLIWRSLSDPDFIMPVTTRQREVDSYHYTSGEDSESQESDIVQLVKKEYRLEAPLDILMSGDSFMITNFGPQLEQRFVAIPGMHVSRFGKIATGFNRNSGTYYWPTEIVNQINQYNPDVILLSIGANDVNPMLGYTYDQQEWQDIYRERVVEFLDNIPDDIEVFWIGHVISGDAIWNEGIQVIMDIYKEEIDKRDNHHFIDLWDEFLIDGGYATYYTGPDGNTVRFKDSDTIHLSYDGAKYVIDSLMTKLNEFIVLDE